MITLLNFRTVAYKFRHLTDWFCWSINGKHIHQLCGFTPRE